MPSKPQPTNNPAQDGKEKVNTALEVALTKANLEATEAVAPALRKKAPMSTQKILKLYVVPIVAVVVFIGMLFILIIPQLSGIFQKLDHISSLSADYDTLVTNEKDLQTLTSKITETNSDLALVNQLAPTGLTEVVNFQRRITDLATQNRLTVVESKSGEQALVVDESIAVLGLVEIPSTFTLQGSFANVKSFIEKIKNLYDFVLIGEMSLTATDKDVKDDLLKTIVDQDWTLEITLTKYQFQVPDAQNKLAEAYLRVPPTVQVDKDTLEFVRGKYQANQPTGEN
jgi:Tfp pilus assembly protein PilO